MSQNNPSLLFDIGGTNMRLGISRDGKTFESARIVPTPQNYEDGIALLMQISSEILAGTPAKAVVGGVAGSLSRDKSAIYNSPHLPNWKGKNLGHDLKEHFKCRVNIENDTALVGLGEAVAGAGIGFSVAAYVTVSTGVNGVKIEDGRISKNFLGYEIGHHLINFDATLTHIEYGEGEFEDFVGGAAISARAGNLPLKIEDNKLWAEITEYLAIGLYNTVLFWSPEILIVGGPLLEKISFDVLKSTLYDKLKKVYPDTPRIAPASLGEFGGLQGAALVSQLLDEA